MRLPSDFRPIQFHQTCAIARVVLLRDATVTNFEWHEAVKDTCAKQGYLPPELDMLNRACRAVEQSLLQTMGRRPVKDLVPPVPELKPEKPPLTPQEWAAFAITLRSVLARSANAAPDNVRTIATETLMVNEPAALDRFYAEAEVDRPGALRRFAEIAIVQGDDWNPDEIRAHSRVTNLHASACFSCRASSRPLSWHHVIQIQHGGTNYLRNRVALCDPCHADVHPWLPRVSRKQKGWSSFADAAVDIERFLKAAGIKRPGEVA